MCETLNSSLTQELLVTFPRKLLVPIKSPDEPSEKSVAVQGILNWISETSYWTGSDKDFSVKRPTLQQVIEEFRIISGSINFDENKVIVRFGQTIETVRLKVLSASTARTFWESISKQGTFPDSKITLIITTGKRFEGLGSLFGEPKEEIPMSDSYTEYSDENLWFRHSCWDQKIFSKPEVWETGFLREEESSA